MTTADLLKKRTPPISADLLEFGIGVFQAAVLGECPGAADGADGLAFMGVKAVERELFGHGLAPEEEVSLLFRVLAFPKLLKDAIRDPHLRTQVRPFRGGYEVSETFLRAAAKCSLVDTPGGAFKFDLKSLKGHLLN